MCPAQRGPIFGYWTIYGVPGKEYYVLCSSGLGEVTVLRRFEQYDTNHGWILPAGLPCAGPAGPAAVQFQGNADLPLAPPSGELAQFLQVREL